jgi:hypothetical protein
MADMPTSDTSRTQSIEPDQSWPEVVEVRLQWRLPSGRVMATIKQITADEFFGRGKIGAPLNGDAIVSMIERLRREGPPREKAKPFKREGKDASRK